MSSLGLRERAAKPEILVIEIVANRYRIYYYTILFNRLLFNPELVFSTFLRKHISQWKTNRK